MSSFPHAAIRCQHRALFCTAAGRLRFGSSGGFRRFCVAACAALISWVWPQGCAVMCEPDYQCQPAKRPPKVTAWRASRPETQRPPAQRESQGCPRARPGCAPVRRACCGGHSAPCPRRLPERAGEPGLEGALVPPQARHAVLPQGPRRPAHARQRRRPPRLRGGPGLRAQTPVCLQDPAKPTGGGHPGGERAASGWPQALGAGAVR